MAQIRDLLDKETVDALYAMKRRMQRSARRRTQEVHSAQSVQR